MPVTPSGASLVVLAPSTLMPITSGSASLTPGPKNNV